MNTEVLYGLFKSTGGKVCTDTRHIVPGSIFFALKGENFDGNKFAADAVKTGAAYAVVDDASVSDSKLIHVENTLKALQDLARHHRRQLKDTKIIALTGSNGKTTTKELLAAVLAKKYKTAATKGNLNNHLGVPLTLLGIKDDCRMAVVEMGANHVREIESLCHIAEPNTGLITNIGKAHLEGFGGIAGVKKGKGELYEWLRSGSHTVFANNDDMVLMGMLGSYENVVLYGSGEGGLVCGITGMDGNCATLEWHHTDRPENKFRIHSQLTGLYNASNMLAAVCVGTYFEVNAEDIVAAIESYVPANSRSQLVKSDSNLLLLDHYNANPESMVLAFENLKSASPGKYDKRMAILGEMRELGAASQVEHQAIVDRVSQSGIDIIFVGEQFLACRIPQAAKSFSSSEQAAKWLKSQNLTGYYILVKGSRGVKMEKVVKVLTSGED